ncbi:MAG: phosphoglycerate kinase [Acidimicrobiia bacterium]
MPLDPPRPDLPKLEDLPLTRGSRVLVRIDCNTPLRPVDSSEASSESAVEVADDLRLTTVIPTITWLREQGAAVVLCGHLGRPKGTLAPQYSLAPVAKRLSELLGIDVALAPAVVGPAASDRIASLGPGDVMLLENLRFEKGETDNSPGFAVSLCEPVDAYVNEAFGASHREHASIVGPPPILPSAAGLLLLREVEVLSGLLRGAAHPFVAVLGGSKVSDKLAVIEALLERCDTILVGGAMAFTFLVAKGHSIGDSLVELDRVDDCKRLLATGRVRVPVDVVIARDISEDAEVRVVKAGAIADGWKGLDIGPETAVLFSDEIDGARTVLWNGPMGVFEVTPFAAGTRTIAEAVADCSGFTVIGGGDSGAAIRQFGLADRVDHVSTGGGASLELIELGDLPGLRALRENDRGTHR